MLTLSTIKAAKPQPKPYRLPDFGGLVLQVQPSGGKVWRLRYLRPGTRKENMLSFGSFPTVSLQDAREAREDARRLLSRGIGPGLQKMTEKLAKVQKAANTFGAIADEYFDKRARETDEDPSKRECSRYDNHLKPILCNVPIAEVTAPMLLMSVDATNNHFERLKEINTDKGEDEPEPPSSLTGRVIDTSAEPHDKLLLVHRQYIINRSSTAKHLEELVALNEPHSFYAGRIFTDSEIALMRDWS